MASSLLSARFRYAFDLVAKLFARRMRKFGDVPYTAHLFAVCYAVSQFTEDEDVRLAALLHDVLEDLPVEVYSAKQMEVDFGPRVLELVQTVSLDEERFGDEGARQRYLQQLEEGPVEACLISAADLLHNDCDLLYWLGREPETALRLFGGERAKRRWWFAKGRYEIIKRRLGARHALVRDLRGVLKELDAVRQRFEDMS